MIKQYRVILLSSVLCVGLIGCSGPVAPSDKPDNQVVQPQLEESGEEEIIQEEEIEEKEPIVITHENGYKAMIEYVGMTQSISLEKDGEVTLIEEILPENGSMLNISKFAFENDGKWIRYRLSAGDAVGEKIYDIENDKLVQVRRAIKDGLTQNEQYYYECHGDGMMGNFFNVYELPAWEKVFTLDQAPISISQCKGYDALTNTFDLLAQGDVERVFDFETLSMSE